MQKTDAELVHAALANPEAFANIVAKYDKRLHAFVMRLGSLDGEEAKDILQETFIKSYINLNDYDPSLPLSGWLYRIARNETINYYRKKKNQPRPVTREEDVEIFDRIADDLDIEHEVNIALDREAVRAALDALDVKYRDALLLRFFEEKTYGEISDIMEIPEGTVAAYISRAKAKLKEMLGRYDKRN